MPKGQFFSCLKARRMISKDCIYYLVWARDIDVETPTLESVPIVNEFLEMFLNNYWCSSQKGNRLRINDLFDQLQGTSYFPKIELQSGYHQLRVCPYAK
ncbi:hypothetical protein MTR67_023950 [Solanum verrucosum]|uniref:RNA-directed DNA polymerase-like protein n=1 Tax=Solanum verrucosum TaxID=315347 RepID=A0AAF0TY33_SOLVR|nr:hypothetical protein MTR67_023950 [Solanum verrucosum]